MRPRTKARSMALQMLYQREITRDTIQHVQELFWQGENASNSDEVKYFANLLIEGVKTHRQTIDHTIQSTAKNWTLERMPVVDLCILRIATYEIIYLADIPSAVSIDEAIELAKTYSTENSPKFINGVLDKIQAIAPDLVSLEHLRTSRADVSNDK
jgi:transcription antitermination protein NusB